MSEFLDGSGSGPAGGPRWPVAELDDVRRMRVLAAVTPGAGYAETRLDVPVDEVWRYVGDVERSMPALIGDFRSFRIVGGKGARLTARAVGVFGQRGRFEVELRPGWCLMQSRLVVGGFAAVADGDGTLFAGCGGLRVPGTRPISSAVATRGLRRACVRLRRELSSRA